MSPYFTKVQNILNSFGNILLCYYGIFKKCVLLMYTLECESSVANFISAYEESQ